MSVCFTQLPAYISILHIQWFDLTSPHVAMLVLLMPVKMYQDGLAYNGMLFILSFMKISQIICGVD
jgi:hypothetical protein